MNLTTIDNAILAHRAWISRFRASVSGISTEKFSTAEACDDTACSLGKWLLTDSTDQLPTLVHYQIVAQHKIFHRYAADIVELINHCESTATIDSNIAELDKLSKQLIALLTAAKFYYR